MDELPIVDAHHHFWLADPNRYPKFARSPKSGFFMGDYSAMCRDFLPHHYRAEIGAHRVVGSVHIEAEWRRDDQLGESAWIDSVAAQSELPTVFVGHVWFDDPDVQAKLEAHAQYARIRGIRSKPALPNHPQGNEEGRGQMSERGWRRGFSLLKKFDLSWDLRVPHNQLPEAAELLTEFDDVATVVNHTGFPWDRSDDGLEAWRRDLRRIAQCPQVHLKLSEFGLADKAWEYEENRRLVLEAIEIFGVERCMFASNFPVAGLRISLDELYTAYKAMVADFSRGEQLALFHDNAARFYRISSP